MPARYSNLPPPPAKILTPAAADARSRTWDTLHESAAPYQWPPVAIDVCLNASCALLDIGDAADYAALHLPANAATELVDALRARAGDSPFWRRVICPTARFYLPAQLHGNPSYLDAACEMAWGVACGIIESYRPVGECNEGLRPHYYAYYLRRCIRGAGAKIRALVPEAYAIRGDDPVSGSALWASLADPRIAPVSLEMSEAVASVLPIVHGDPELRLAHRLLVEQELTIREAAVTAGRSSSGMGRLADRYAATVRRGMLQGGWEVPASDNGCDTHRTLSAWADLLLAAGIAAAMIPHQ